MSLPPTPQEIIAAARRRGTRLAASGSVLLLLLIDALREGGRTRDAELAALASRFPSRPIGGSEAAPYLTRYFLAEDAAAGSVYLHHFHRGDGDPELHNHPWGGISLILAGGYREERRIGDAESYRVEQRVYRAGSVNELEADTFHRLDLLEDAGECWTLFVTGPRVQTWGFWDRTSGAFTPWDEFVARRAPAGGA
jgi:hypothetical protein